LEILGVQPAGQLGERMRIIADYKHYKQLNEEVFQAVQAGVAELTLEDVNGKGLLADCLTGKLQDRYLWHPWKRFGNVYGWSNGNRLWERPRWRSETP